MPPPGAAETLQEGGHRARRVDLDDAVEVADIDPEFQSVLLETITQSRASEKAINQQNLSARDFATTGEARTGSAPASWTFQPGRGEHLVQTYAHLGFGERFAGGLFRVVQQPT